MKNSEKKAQDNELNNILSSTINPTHTMGDNSNNNLNKDAVEKNALTEVGYRILLWRMDAINSEYVNELRNSVD